MSLSSLRRPLHMMKKGLEKLPQRVYHSGTAHQLRTRVDNTRHGAKAALNGYVGFLEKGCLQVTDHAEKAGRDLKRHAMRFARVAKKAVRDMGRHAGKVAHEAAVDAGGVVVQGAEDAASIVRNSAKNSASRVRGVARKLNSTGRDSLSQLASKLKSRKYEPANYLYAEPARADSGEPGCVETLENAAQQCRVDGDTTKAYKAVYDYATYVDQQALSQQTYLINYAELLLIAEVVQSNISRLHSHHLTNQTAAFTTVIFDMHAQALRLPAQEDQEARG
jgi:phosphohistidine phosphatase SixA